MRNPYLNRRSSSPCPRCGRLISLNSERCIHCNLPRPGYFYRIPVLSDVILGRVSFVDGISIVCIALYLLALALDIPNSLTASGIFNILSPTNDSLYKLGMGGAIPWHEGRWWTLITANYLHAGLLHIGFNMLWLRRLGPFVEELFGASRFWILYTISGLTGSVISTAAGTFFFVGASGAIFGLFGALVYYGRHRGGTFGSNIFRQMLIWATIAFLFGFIGTGIDNWGHLGGFLGGLFAAIILGYEEKNRQTLTQHLVATGLIILVSVSFVLMFINFFS